MVKSKSQNKNVEKEVNDVISYATKEEEDEFLKFSDDENNDSESVSDDDENSNKPVSKAYDVAMSDDEDLSDEDEDDKISVDLNDNEEDDNDEDSEKPIDRKSAKELAKTYAERNRRTLFVGNLTSKISKKSLIQLFNSKKAAGEGAVESVRLRGAVGDDNHTNPQSKRKAVIMKKFADNENQVLCAFVVLNKEEDVEKCLCMNNHLVDGKHIRVDRVNGKKMSYTTSNCVFVGNLPYSVNEEMVRSAFEKCGEIINVRLVRNKTDGKLIGIGYVEFTESLAVDFALKLSGQLEIEKRVLRIEKWTQSKTQKERRKMPMENNKTAKKFKVVPPSNMKGVELKEFIMSKKKKMIKKADKRKTFIKNKKEKSTKNKEIK